MFTARLEPHQALPVLSVFAASLLGSGHCGSMCGGFAVLAGKDGKLHRGIVLFHFGRLVIYLTLGSLAGSLGTVLNSGIISRASEIASCSILVVLAWRVVFPKIKTLHSTKGWQLVNKSRANRALFPFVLGAITALLPCGWLYAFLAIALGSGGVESAALVMAFFWAGTLPILSIIGISAHFIGEKIQLFNNPRIKAALLLFAAVSSFFPHYFSNSILDLSTRPSKIQSQLICHGKTIAN